MGDFMFFKQKNYSYQSVYSYIQNFFNDISRSRIKYISTNYNKITFHIEDSEPKILISPLQFYFSTSNCYLENNKIYLPHRQAISDAKIAPDYGLPSEIRIYFYQAGDCYLLLTFSTIKEYEFNNITEDQDVDMLVEFLLSHGIDASNYHDKIDDIFKRISNTLLTDKLKSIL